MTEMCFLHCADNFFTRELTTEESNCLDKCVFKFSNVNQRVMAAYVHDQAIINERRMKEMEQQVKANEAAPSVASNVPAIVSSSSTPVELNTTTSTSASVVNLTEIQNQG